MSGVVDLALERVMALVLQLAGDGRLALRVERRLAPVSGAVTKLRALRGAT